MELQWIVLEEDLSLFVSESLSKAKAKEHLAILSRTLYELSETGVQDSSHSRSQEFQKVMLLCVELSSQFEVEFTKKQSVIE